MIVKGVVSIKAIAIPILFIVITLIRGCCIVFFALFTIKFMLLNLAYGTKKSLKAIIAKDFVKRTLFQSLIVFGVVALAVIYKELLLEVLKQIIYGKN